MATRPTTKHGDFTKKANKDYLDGKCPYCPSRNCESTGKEIADDFTISRRIQCGRCKKEWWEVYEMRCIEPVRN